MRAIRYLFCGLLWLSFLLQGVSASQDAIRQIESLLQKPEVTDQDKQTVQRLITGLSRMTDGTSRQAAERFGYRWKIKLLESEVHKTVQTRDVVESSKKEQELKELLSTLGVQSADEAKHKIAESKLSVDQKAELIAKNTQELAIMQQENTVLKKSIEELKKSYEHEKKTREEAQAQQRQIEERAALNQLALGSSKQELDTTRAQLATCQDGLSGRGEIEKTLVQAQQNLEEQTKKVGAITQEKESFKVKCEQAQQQLMACMTEKEKALQQVLQSEQKVEQGQAAHKNAVEAAQAELTRIQGTLSDTTRQLNNCKAETANQQELRQQLANAQRELEITKIGKATAETEKVQLQEQIKENQGALEAAESEKAALTKSLQSKESELTACSGRLVHQQVLETELNALKTELQEEKTRGATAIHAKTEIEQRLAVLSQEKNELASTLSDSKRAAEVAANELAACRTNLANQDELKQQLAAVQQQLQEQAIAKESFIKEKEAIRIELAQQKQINEQAVAGLQQQLAIAKKESENAKKEVATCQNSVVERDKLHEQRLNLLQRDLDDAKAGRAELVRENSLVKAEFERIKTASEASQREKTELQQKLQAANNLLLACQTGLADCEKITPKLAQFERDLELAARNAEVVNKAKIEAEKRVTQLQADLEKSKADQQTLEVELKNLKASAPKPTGFGTGGFGGGTMLGKLPLTSSECDNKLRKIRQALSYYHDKKRSGLLFKDANQLKDFIEQYISPIVQGNLDPEKENEIKNEPV